MILIYSATGNTVCVARQLGRLLGEEVVSLHEADANRLKGQQRIVWCFPIHSWGMPKAVRGFIDSLVMPAESKHIMVCTCGDDIGMADHQWRKALAKRGATGGAAFSVQMPNTYVALPGFDVDSPEVVSLKLKQAAVRVEEIARAIDADEPVGSVVRGAFARVKTGLLYPLFMRFLTHASRFTVNDDCVGCGKCLSAKCGYIELKEGRPIWRHERCNMCMACYHSCPRHAINYTRFTRKKGQYLANQ